MSDYTLFFILALPPAVVEFLALVWAKGRLRLILAATVFALPLAIFGWLLATAHQANDVFARLGLITLAIVLLGGALTGAVLGAIVMGLRHLRRRAVPAGD